MELPPGVFPLSGWRSGIVGAWGAITMYFGVIVWDVVLAPVVGTRRWVGSDLGDFRLGVLGGGHVGVALGERFIPGICLGAMEFSLQGFEGLGVQLGGVWFGGLGSYLGGVCTELELEVSVGEEVFEGEVPFGGVL